MALRLGEQVLCGEIFNTRKYSVHGWLQLRDWDHPLILQLTGNCDADLAGWHFRFQVPSSAEQHGHPTQQGGGCTGTSGGVDLSVLARQQIGPTGVMTAARSVKTANRSAAELYVRHKLDEPPPMESKRCMYLEWFSQNGRVVVELADPILEFIEYTQWEQTPGGGSAPAHADEPDDVPPAAPDCASPDTDEDGPDTNENGPDTDENDDEICHGCPELLQPDEECEEDCDDPYRLIPDALQRQFDADARQTELKLQFDCDDEDKPECVREMELMDELIENSPGVPLDMIFEGPLKLPRPGQLDEEEAERALGMLLAQLALFGVSLDICEHFTLGEAYRLLLEEICPDATAYPELRHTQWVQSFSTSEYCPECEAEFEREHEEHQRRREQEPYENRPGDEDEFLDDLPF